MSRTDYLFVCLGIIKEALCQKCLSSYLYCSNLSALLVFTNILGKYLGCVYENIINVENNRSFLKYVWNQMSDLKGQKYLSSS